MPRAGLGAQVMRRPPRVMSGSMFRAVRPAHTDIICSRGKVWISARWGRLTHKSSLIAILRQREGLSHLAILLRESGPDTDLALCIGLHGARPASFGRDHCICKTFQHPPKTCRKFLRCGRDENQNSCVLPRLWQNSVWDDRLSKTASVLAAGKEDLAERPQGNSAAGSDNEETDRCRQAP